MPGIIGSHLTRERTRDLLLTCLTFAAGAVDAISFFGLGRIFTAQMSGNIILLGLAVGRGESADALRSGIALVAFAGGVFVAARLTRQPGKPGSWPAGATVALALEAVLQAGFLAGWLATSGHPAHVAEAVLAGTSALAMGLQSGAVAVVGVPGVTSTYVTGTLTGLVGELARRTGDRTDWTRRGLVLVALLAGATCGGLLLVEARRAAPVLPLAVTTFVIATRTTRAHSGAANG